MKSSLSLRLLVAAALSTLVALLATALLLNNLFRDYFENRVHAELDAWLVSLTSQTQLDTAGQPVISDMGDPRFSQPLSGHYWQVTGEDFEPILSRSFWSQPMDVPRPDMLGSVVYDRLTGPDGEAYVTGSWGITLDHEGTDKELILTIALDQASVDAPIEGFARNVSIFMVILGSFLVLASWFTVRIGLKPLKTVRSEVNNVKTNPGSRLSTDCAMEVAPLVKEVNDLLEEQEQAVRAARARASTLAHGLKTPLTVMQAVAQEVRSAGGSPSVSDEIDTQVSNMQHLVERELARTRDQVSSQTMRCEVEPVVAKLVSAFQRRIGSDNVEWHVDIADGAQCPFDAFALTELLGNLIDNATKWTNDRIEISAAGTAAQGFIQVADNGSGISEDQLETVVRRGKRLDDTVPGHGLGLSIVRDMVALRDVNLLLSNAQEGGLVARIEWGGES